MGRVAFPEENLRKRHNDPNLSINKFVVIWVGSSVWESASFAMRRSAVRSRSDPRDVTPVASATGAFIVSARE